MRRLLISGVCVLTLAAALPASAVTIAELDRIDIGALETVGFELNKDAEITIEAVGLRLNKSRDLSAYAWIIDSDTRDLVWEMKSRRTDRLRHSDYLRDTHDTEMLPAGRYELYYYAASGWNIEGGWDGVKVILDGVFSGDWEDFDELQDEVDECYVTLTSDELSESNISQFTPDGGLPNALIRHNALGDSEYIRSGFKLDRDMSLKIYALVEYPRGYREPVDYCWVVNNDTRERVWTVTKWDTEHAGGGRKNQVFNEEVEFEAGSYTLHVVTDDSHSYEEFNVAPPYDPINWGVTILPGSNFQASAFHLIDPPDRGRALIDFTRARDDDYFEQSFKLSKETELEVYAIGEYSSSDRGFVDYGAIYDAASALPVFEMTKRNTEHAGGGEKNRMFDGTITLPAGTYTAVYRTDGSHSYRDWNTSPPYDVRSYGMSIYPTSNTDESAFKAISEEEVQLAENILARIIRVGDDERRRARFTLDKESRIRIYALGEGTGGRMYDFAYIIDEETGRDVWEMTWRRTEHAGGASKNRVFNDVIRLPSGTYEVVYESDDSHSFAEWNSTPPRDPRNWGVTITLEE